MIDGLSESVTVVKEAKARVDVVQLFVISKRELEAQLGKLRKVLGPKGIL